MSVTKLTLEDLTNSRNFPEFLREQSDKLLGIRDIVMEAVDAIQYYESELLDMANKLERQENLELEKQCQQNLIKQEPPLYI